jgi:hypothetical protein
MNDRNREKPDTQIDSPGNGMTVMRLSKFPLATEGEATPGADDYNMFDDPDVDDADLPETAGGIPFLDDVDAEPQTIDPVTPSFRPTLPDFLRD